MAVKCRCHEPALAHRRASALVHVGVRDRYVPGAMGDCVAPVRLTIVSIVIKADTGAGNAAAKRAPAHGARSRA
jgi:hypothetical protein